MKTSLPPSKRQGFTLIELLVVVAIIAILAVVGMAIFSGVQSRARDARRQSDIQAITKAFEANKASGSAVYPAILASWFAGSTIPADTYAAGGPVYSIAYVDAPSCAVGLAAATSRVWVTTSTTPGSTTFSLSPAACDTLVIGAVSTAPANMTSFQVCALLESGTAPNIYCIPNSQ